MLPPPVRPEPAVIVVVSSALASSAACRPSTLEITCACESSCTVAVMTALAVPLNVALPITSPVSWIVRDVASAVAVSALPVTLPVTLPTTAPVCVPEVSPTRSAVTVLKVGLAVVAMSCSVAKVVPVSVRPVPALYTAVSAITVKLIGVVPKVIAPEVFIT